MKEKEFLNEEILKDIKELISKIDPNKIVFNEVNKNIEEEEKLNKQKTKEKNSNIKI